MRYIGYLYTIALLLTVELGYAQKLPFSYLGVTEGLSQNSATSLVQDSIGRIWIGTRDGLNMYDGSRIKTIRPIRGDSTSILGHSVVDLNLDGDILWVVTKSGVSRLDIKDMGISQFPKEETLSIISHKGDILVGTYQGILRLDIENRSFEQSDLSHFDNYRVDKLYKDNSGSLWVVTDQGAYLCGVDNNISKIIDKSCTAIFRDSKKQIWIGTESDGVYLFDSKYNLKRHFYHNRSELSLIDNQVRDIEEDRYGDIWIGTFRGLSIVNYDSHEISSYSHSDLDSRSLSNNSVYDILRDKQGNMWIGTYFGGVNYLSVDASVYQQYPIKPDSPKGTNFGVIGEMLEDSDNNLWIATEGGGLDYLDRELSIFHHHVESDLPSGLSHNNIKALAFGDNNRLLIGTHQGGLNIMDIESGEVKTYLNDPEDSGSIPSNVVDDIVPYRDFFLLGTKKGVVKYDPKTDLFSSFFEGYDEDFSDKHINSLFEDSFKKLWIGTEKYGVYIYDEVEDKIVNHKSSQSDMRSIGSNDISVIFEDHQFRLWIGTHGGGLDLYDRDEDSFHNFNMAKDNLLSDYIFGIAESRYGNLWISTVKGLSRFNVEENKVHNYSQKSGFPLSELNGRSLYTTTDGDLFVGGIEGLVSFSEKDLFRKIEEQNLTITSLNVNNREVSPLDETGILFNSLPYTKEISLTPDHNVFSVGFSACNYRLIDQNIYRYKLENFDVEWINTDDQTTITYTNLNPGSYTLRVQQVDDVDGSVVVERALEIDIMPRFYRSWYAILIYLVALLIVLWIVRRTYLSRVELLNAIRAEKQDKEQLKQLNQSKLNFFTNISHEFRTPLTLITGTLENVMSDSKVKGDLSKRLITVHNNAVRLNNLITELLDFRKLESGSMNLKFEKVELSKFLNEIYLSFAEYAKDRGVEYSFNPNIKERLLLCFDRFQMEKVFFNLLSNAFKFIKEDNGSVTIDLLESVDFVDIIIRDNGTGMPADKASKIFDLYYQVENVKLKANRVGSGIGLALCKSVVEHHDGEILVDSIEGVGTTFTVRLPKRQELLLEMKAPISEEPLEDGYTPPKFMELPADETDDESLTTEDAPKLLIVEDDPEVRILLRDIFKDRYQILEAEDGQEGFELATSSQPDIIVSDVMMPKLSGDQMCMKLKRNLHSCHIPIVLLTAKSAVEFKLEGFEVGADDYITKPFNGKLLKSRVKNILKNRSLIQQRFKQDPKIEIAEVTSNVIDQKVLTQAQQIIEDNIDNSEFDVTLFAKEMNMGRTKLYSKLKGIVGQTPNEFIVTIRLQRASEMLLKYPEMNVSEIAYAVGFATPRYFSRCFRQHFGVSPTQYGSKG